MRGTRILIVCIVLLIMAGCGSPQPTPSELTAIPTLAPVTPPPEPTAVPSTPASEEPVPEEPAAEKPASAESTEWPAFAGLPLPTEQGELFAASGTCAVCHTGMVDEAGADVSTDSFWRSTMMANSSRDPYWQASVREEVLAQPAYQAVIEDTCAKCHMPMARFTAAASGGAGEIFDGFLSAEHEYHTLALDGVSCTLCHQIEEAGFGEADSFSGGFEIDADLPTGGRLNFGPFPVPKGLAASMQVASGFIPVESQHIRRAEMCATCHTLYTPYIDAAGKIAGTFPEQTPYLEWSHSAYREDQTCQECHMPAAQGGVQLSVTGGPPRAPFAQHVFVGGNAYMLRMFRAFGEERAVTASSEHFEDKIARVENHLQGLTAALAVEDTELSGSKLSATVSIQSLVGHKFPSGFPSRRTWLHFVVRDTDGQVVFESGAVNPDGSIGGNDNDADASMYEPHYQEIVSSDQVQIYETIFVNTEGDVTTTLLRAAEYVKDNRLLPSGFDKQTADGNIAVYGEAASDADFIGGGEVVAYDVDLGDAEGPFAVTAELLYQSIGYRWAQNLGQHEAPEITRFLDYYEAVPNLPVVVASATVEVGG